MNNDQTLILTANQAVESTNPDSQTRRRKILCKQELIIASLQAFYSSRPDLAEIMELLQGTSMISLRLIDWFVTNYAKRNSIGYIINGQEFMVYMSYKSQLKAYSKKRFDPFCRWDRITIPYDNENFMETTIGQLNFFKWAIENKIVDFIEQNYQDIENDMNHRNSTSKNKDSLENLSDVGDNSKTRKKREELSVSACKCIKKETVKIVVKFS
jgi:hypothetical protein